MYKYVVYQGKIVSGQLISLKRGNWTTESRKGHRHRYNVSDYLEILQGTFCPLCCQHGKWGADGVIIGQVGLPPSVDSTGG